MLQRISPAGLLCCVLCRSLSVSSLLSSLNCCGSQCVSSLLAFLCHLGSLCLVSLYFLCEKCLGSGYFLVGLCLADFAVLSVFLSLPSIETLLSLFLTECAFGYTAVQVLHQQHTLTGEDVTYGVGRLCTYVQPIQCTLKVEDHCTRIGVGVERTDTFDNFAITWRAAVCYYDVVESIVFVTMTSQTNLCCHLDFCFVGYDYSNRLPGLENK